MRYGDNWVAEPCSVQLLLKRVSVPNQEFNATPKVWLLMREFRNTGGDLVHFLYCFQFDGDCSLIDPENITTILKAVKISSQQATSS